jgi:type II secretory pathway pseudopilin PulG
MAQAHQAARDGSSGNYLHYLCHGQATAINLSRHDSIVASSAIAGFLEVWTRPVAVLTGRSCRVSSGVVAACRKGPSAPSTLISCPKRRQGCCPSIPSARMSTDVQPLGVIIETTNTGRRFVDDAGATLLELVVAMSVSTIVAIIFTGGMLQLRGIAERDEALGAAQARLHAAFQRMDSEIRYAVGINEPAHTAGAWWVEYAVTTAGVTRCTQLRVTDATGLLQSRHRTGGGPAEVWRTLADQIDGAREFVRTAARRDRARHQQLSVTLVLSAGAHRGPQLTRQSAFTFTALNTSPATDDIVCIGLNRA